MKDANVDKVEQDLKNLTEADFHKKYPDLSDKELEKISGGAMTGRAPSTGINPKTQPVIRR